MSNDKKDNCGGATNVTSLGYLRVTPIYGSTQQQQQPQSQLMTTNNTVMMTNPSTTRTYVEPIGRKELATTWWENCPNQCMAHLPSNKPCLQYCKPLRKYVSILSKKMITTTHIPHGMMDWDDNVNHHIRKNQSTDCVGKRIMIIHPIATQKQQSKLIHITPIQPSNLRCDASIDTSSYNLRIGNDWTQPWMQFHVTIVPPYPKLVPVSQYTKTTATTLVKRKLDFHPDNNNLSDEERSAYKKKRTCHNVTNKSFHDATYRLQQQDKKVMPKPKYSMNPEQSSENSQDQLSNWLEEAKATIATVDKPATMTQKIYENVVTTTTTTPNDKSERVPNVTPGTAHHHHDSCDVFNNESISKQVLSQRRLFPVREPNDTFLLNKHCERIFQNDFRNASPAPPATAANFMRDKDDYDELSSLLSSQQEKHDNDSSNDEQYATYLSLPLPENDLSPASQNNDSQSSVATPIDKSTKDGTILTGNSVKQCEELYPPRTKVMDLTYHDWKNMNTGHPPTGLHMKAKSQFQKTMIELILLNNEGMESDGSSNRNLWLPSLFNEDTILSSSWKVGKLR
jgi:hypothetical protein